jgi:mRNA interferase MazF
MPDLAPGDIVWVAPDAAVGREQAGHRPAMVMAGTDYLQLIDSLAIVVPLTSVDRGWPNHIPSRASSCRLPRGR